MATAKSLSLGRSSVFPSSSQPPAGNSAKYIASIIDTPPNIYLSNIHLTSLLQTVDGHYLFETSVGTSLEHTSNGPSPLYNSMGHYLLDTSVDQSHLYISVSLLLLDTSVGHPLSDTSFSHSLLETSVSFLDLDTSIGQPLSDTSVSHPDLDTSAGHPHSDTSVSYPPLDASVSHPLLDASVSHPLLDASISHPPLDASISHPPLDASVIRLLLQTSTSPSILGTSVSHPLLDTVDRTTFTSGLLKTSSSGIITAKSDYNLFSSENSEITTIKLAFNSDSSKEVSSTLFDSSALYPSDNRLLSNLLTDLPTGFTPFLEVSSLQYSVTTESQQILATTEEIKGSKLLSPLETLTSIVRSSIPVNSSIDLTGRSSDSWLESFTVDTNTFSTVRMTLSSRPVSEELLSPSFITEPNNPLTLVSLYLTTQSLSISPTASSTALFVTSRSESAGLTSPSSATSTTNYLTSDISPSSNSVTPSSQVLPSFKELSPTFISADTRRTSEAILTKPLHRSSTVLTSMPGGTFQKYFGHIESSKTSSETTSTAQPVEVTDPNIVSHRPVTTDNTLSVSYDHVEFVF